MVNPIIIDSNKEKMINPIEIDPVGVSGKECKQVVKSPSEQPKKLELPVKIDAVKKADSLINPIVVEEKVKSDKPQKHSEVTVINGSDALVRADLEKSYTEILYPHSEGASVSLHYQKFFENCTLNSIGVASKIIEILPEFVYNEEESAFYHWNDVFWEKISIGTVKKLCVYLLEDNIKLLGVKGLNTKELEKFGNTGMFDGVIKMLKYKANRRNADFNTAKSAICLRNGVFDFADCKLHPFHKYKNNYVTSIVDCNFNPHAKSEILDYFLKSIMLDDENVQFLQDVFGYAIMGNPVLQLGFILEGSGSNGKSTLLEAIHSLLGDFVSTLPVSYFTTAKLDDPNRPTPATYSVKDKHIVYTSEAETSSFLNESKIKKFIGGGRLKARVPYGQNVEFENRATLFFDTNHLPHFKDGGFSMERRLMVIPFPATFTKENLDPSLPEKLKSPEAQEALLNWLIEGACRVRYNQKLYPTARVIQATQKFFMEEDTIGQFISDATEFSLNNLISYKDLYGAYVDYCMENCLAYKSSDTFSKAEAIKKLPTVKKRVRYKKGIKLK